MEFNRQGRKISSNAQMLLMSFRDQDRAKLDTVELDKIALSKLTNDVLLSLEKRGRGRPRKNPIEQTQSKPDDVPLLQEKRGRGRPRKIVESEIQTELKENHMPDIKEKLKLLETIKRIAQLTGFSVSTGIGTMPYAFVKLNIDGKEYSGTDHGVGPVDASLNAIQKITGKISEIRIKDYALASISGGSNALCEVTITVEDAQGNRVSAKSVGEDIVTTSVQAVIDGINRIMLKKMLKEKQVS